MLRHVALLAIILASPAIFFAGPVQAGTVTYTIVDYPKDQDGWTLSGTITIKTNAESGTLAEGDIQSWSITIKKGDVTATYGKDKPGEGVDITGTLSYTPKAITLPQGTKDAPNKFSLTGDNLGSNSVTWSNDKSVAGEGVYSCFFINSDKKRMRAWVTGTNTLGGQTNWIIARTVPEPPAILLAGVGFAALFLVRSRAVCCATSIGLRCRLCFRSRVSCENK